MPCVQYVAFRRIIRGQEGQRRGLVRSFPLGDADDIRGFTLIELLVATAILGLVIAAAGACLRAGILAWETSNSFSNSQLQLSLAAASVDKDLANCCLQRGTNVVFSGRADQIDFLRYGLSTNSEQGVFVQRVKYEFQAGNGVLERKVSRANNNGEKGGNGEAASVERFSGFQRVDFQYGYKQRTGKEDGLKWETSATSFPRAVKLRICIKDAEMERGRTIERTVFFPASE